MLPPFPCLLRGLDGEAIRLLVGLEELPDEKREQDQRGDESEDAHIAREEAAGTLGPRLGDDAEMDLVRATAERLAEAGFERYEISNYARPGFECRHNLAVWRGEDYIGLGEGAHGRRGLVRTASGVETTVTPEEDAVERALFSLRTREGLSLDRVARLWPILAPRLPAWREKLEFFKHQGLLQDTYRLTLRGAEVCDSILADLI